MRAARSGATLAGVLAVTLLLPVAASAAPAGDGDGDISVTIVDPTASPQPTSPSGSGGGSSQPGRGGGSGGDTATPPDTEPGPDAEGAGSSWIVVSGLDSSAHGELDPFRGWVRSSVTVANRSETETVHGTLVFRLRTILGTQIGPAVSRTLDGIAPGKAQTGSVRLPGIGQWPLVQVSATFEPDGVDVDPIAREAWVIAFPWLLLVIVVLLVAGAAILWIRRDGIRGPLRHGDEG